MPGNMILRVKMSPKQVLSKWAHFMTTHQLDELVDLYHDDATNLQVAVGTPLVGKEAIRQDYINFFQNIPDTYTTVVNIFEDGDWAIIEWTGGGTFQGKKKFTFEGCGFFNIIEGKIKFQRGYWDMYSWLKRLDLPLE